MNKQIKTSQIKWKKCVGIFNLLLAILAFILQSVGYHYVYFDWATILVIGFLESFVLLALGLLLILERWECITFLLSIITSAIGLTLVILNSIMIADLCNADCASLGWRPTGSPSPLMTSDSPLGNIEYYPDFKMTTSEYDKLCNDILSKIIVYSTMIVYGGLSFLVNFISATIVIIPKCRDAKYQLVHGHEIGVALERMLK